MNLTARGRTWAILAGTLLGAFAGGLTVAYINAQVGDGKASLRSDAEAFADAVNSARYETVNTLLRPECQRASGAELALILRGATLTIDSVHAGPDGTGTVVATGRGGILGPSDITDVQPWIFTAGRWSPEGC